MTTQEKPLITFALFAYNQERFIREALEGAFSQTYSPLEIILSDDCSVDRTFEIMQEMAAYYKGPHAIILNRNKKNLGIGGHVSRFMEIAKGELIVAAAGDDISLPYRAQTIYEAWINSSKKALSLYSSVIIIDEKGKQISLYRKQNNEVLNNISLITKNIDMEMLLIGSSHAWGRQVFDVFGPLSNDIVYEDRVIPFRSALLGDIVHIDSPLVLYRRHSANITAPLQKFVLTEVLMRAIRENRIWLSIFKQNISDLKVIIDLKTDKTIFRSILSILENKISERSRHIKLLDAQMLFLNGSNRVRLSIFLNSQKYGATRIGVFRWFVKVLFPNAFAIYMIRRLSSKRDYFASSQSQ